MESLARDFQLALRRLRMTPGFTLFAVLSLALGIGVSTAVYSAVRTLFWTPVGVPRAEEIVAITSFRSSAAMLIPVPFVIAALVACYVPAARASRVDPNVALRDL